MSNLSRQLIDLEIPQFYKNSSFQWAGGTRKLQKSSRLKSAGGHDTTGMASWSADLLAVNPRRVREWNETNSCRWRIEADWLSPGRVSSPTPCLEELYYILTTSPCWHSYCGEHDSRRNKNTEAVSHFLFFEHMFLCQFLRRLSYCRSKYSDFAWVKALMCSTPSIPAWTALCLLGTAVAAVCILK